MVWYPWLQEHINDVLSGLFAATDGMKPVGFISMKENNQYTVEIYVMVFCLIIMYVGLVKYY